nr:reverse transcriptase domain-containing protein [Tanacetum cinerariifolium]
PRWKNDPEKLFTAPDSLRGAKSPDQILASLPGSDQSSNPTSSTNPNPKGRNRGRSKQRVENSNHEEHFPPIVTMADQRIMAQLLQAPTEGYEDAVFVPAITSTLKFPDVLNTSIKLMLFPFSLKGAAQIWLEKEPPRSILTWDDLVSKFINQFFPLSKITSLRNEIINFQQRFNESFSEKDMVKALLLDKKGQNQSPAPVKAVEESCVTCGGAHSYHNCPATDGNVYRDPGKFLIPCDFPGMAECLALADLDASINLMPYYVRKRLSLPDLTPTYMTLELADRSISLPVGVAKDVYVKVGSFHFLADFVVVDFDADPRVPLILRRSFFKTGRALIDVFECELTLRVGKEAITYNLDQTSRYSANYSDITAKRIDVIDMACEEYSQEVLDFSDTISSGNPTSFYDPIVSATSPTLTPFGNSDFLLEEVDAFLAVEDELTSSNF